MKKIVPGNILVQETVKSSSSDNVYTVTLYDNCISCNCPAGIHNSFCKHAESVLKKNMELIKTANIEFYNKVAVLFELKDLSKKYLDDYKVLSKEVLL